MGRVIVAAGLGSGRIGENSRNTAGKNRTKRKKRKKDLEKLHRNVHEAKDNLRRGAARETKSTAFSKVLTNFADTRQHNDETTHAIAWKKGKKKNPRTICDRLLPEPIVGLYKNGAKGRQAYRVDERLDGTSIARLESNVLKLLNGDGTNPNLFENQDAKRRRKGEEKDRSEESVGSNVTSQSSRLVTDSPPRGKTKGNNWINRENEKNVVGRKGPEKRNERLQPQRESRCKRRLFEPNDESASDENSFGIIDRSEIMNEICFTPRITVDHSESRNNVEKYSAPMEEREIAEKLEGKFDWRRVPSNFWSWSPETCYERLCAKVCAENFETNQRSIGSDPIAKAQKALGKLYALSNPHGPSKEKKNVETFKRHERVDSRKDSPLHNFSSLSTFVESDDCAADLELEGDSPDSCTIKVGSWHADNFREISSENDGTPDEDTNGRKKNRAKDSSGPDARRETNEDREPQRNNRKTRLCEEKPSTDQIVRRSINSVFLKTLAEPNDSSNGKNTFAAQFAAAAQLCPGKGKSDNNYDESRHLKIDIDAKKSVLRRNRKHVPHILRRSSRRSEILNYINESFQDTRQQSEKVVDSRADIRPENYTSDGSGSISSQNAKFDANADFDRIPRDPSELNDIDKEHSFKSRVDLFAGKKNTTRGVERSRNIGGETSSAELADVESFDDTRCTRLTPDHRYVEEAKDHCTCFTQPRGRAVRRVTFDLEEHPSRFKIEPEPNHQRLKLPLGTYHDDSHLEKTTRNFAAFVSDRSEIEQKRAINRHSEVYDQRSSFHEADVSADYTSGVSLQKRIRKPVVLFKPIRSNIDDRQRFSSHRETDDNTVATVRNAVKNLNVHANSENFEETSFANQFSNVSYQHQRHAEQSLSQSLGRTLAIGNDTIHGQILETRPTKFLAYLQGDGRDPERIPIYANSDRSQVVAVVPVPVNDRSESSGISVGRIPQFAEMMYVKCPDVENSNEQLSRYQQQRPISNNVASTSTEIPRNLFNMTNGELLPSACLNYRQPPYGIHRNPNEGFRGIENFNRRIRLADGTTGIFVPDNRGIDKEGTFGIGERSELRDPRGAATHHHHQLLHRHRKSSNNVAAAATSNDVLRNGFDMSNGEPIASSQIEYRPEYRMNTNYNRRFQVNENPPNRIELADGSTGMFYSENRPIDTERTFGIEQQSQSHNPHGTATSNKIPRNIVDMSSDHVPPASIRLKYQPQYSIDTHFNGAFQENSCLPNRVLLADGTTGIFVPENRSIV